MSDWKVFRGEPLEAGAEPPEWRLPEAPPWRPGVDEQGNPRPQTKGRTFRTPVEAINMVNTALFLRRPLLVTGKPGTGKSSLAYAVAEELGMGEVLYWPIITRTTIKDGLYSYDAIGRAQDRLPGQDNLEVIGNYVRLGPLGTALLPSKKPRVLLIDEIDKSDIDLPNDLLHVFEEGSFEIPELFRIREKKPEVRVRTAYSDPHHPDSTYVIPDGRVQCHEFPFVVLTSNGERDFPAPFLRRCVRLTMEEPNEAVLTEIVEKHLGEHATGRAGKLIQNFYEKRNQSKRDLATDQLLNAVYLMTRDQAPTEVEWKKLQDNLLKYLDSREDV